MTTKKVKYNKSAAEKLPNNNPVLYKVKTSGGRTNYVGIAKRGRVQARIKEHINAGKIPGAYVQVQQMSSIAEARKKEQSIISRTKPK